MSRPTLYLVDASGHVHRAFHAIRGLRNSRGMATNALYGLATMLRKFQKERKPEFVAVVFDAGRETFRNEMFAGYKANRPPAPDDLVVQFPYARRIAAALGFRVFEVPGFEADDVIATLTRWACERGMDVVIESGDKDLFQLVGEGVVVHDPMRDVTYDREGVVGKIGVPPERVREYLALVGDSSDNVPGVRGIGEKGAAELIARYGTLEALYEHLEEVAPRKREALETCRHEAFLSRDLVTLKRDVPLDVEVEALRPREPDRAGVLALWTELEFRSLVDEMRLDQPGAQAAESVVGAPGAETGARGGDHAVETRQGVRFEEVSAGDAARVSRRLREAERLAVVMEFRGRDPVRPDVVAVGVALSGDEVLVMDAGAALAPDAGFAEVLPRACVPDYKQVWQAVRAARGGRGDEVPLPAVDPLLAAYVVHPERESPTIGALSLQLLGESLPPATDTSCEAVARRAAAAWRVAPLIEAQVRGAGLWGLLSDIEIPLSRVLGDMETTGVRVDREVLVRLSRELTQEIQRLEADIVRRSDYGPFNPNSPKQLADLLFGKLGIQPPRKTKTGPSTDSAVLEQIADDPRALGIPRLILQYRSLTKLKSTYADALGGLIRPETGRIHTSYNQTVAATGRLSSSDPNLQNIPVRTPEGLKVRGAFVSDDGYEFLSADYSQIELRVLAHLSGDEALSEAFRQGADIHARTAARVFRVPEEAVTPDRRRFAKTINFGLLYGMGAFRLARDLRIEQAEAQRFIADYFAAFPRVKEYLEGVVEAARREGVVQTITGRRRAIEGLNDRNHNVRSAAERMALNTPIQGSAADIIKVAMVRLRERLRASGLDARMVLQVHDELVLEVREGQTTEAGRLVKEVMEGAWVLDVPLVVDLKVGRRWSEMTAIKT